MTPLLEGLPTKAKEAPSPHEVRLAPLENQPSILMSRGRYNITQKYYQNVRIDLVDKLVFTSGVLL